MDHSSAPIEPSRNSQVESGSMEGSAPPSMGSEDALVNSMPASRTASHGNQGLDAKKGQERSPLHLCSRDRRLTTTTTAASPTARANEPNTARTVEATGATSICSQGLSPLARRMPPSSPAA